MTDKLDAVLARIDQNFDGNVARLFDFLRIQSISTDPAYVSQCRTAAEFVAKEMGELGLDAKLRPTDGHPVVVGKSAEANDNGAAPRILFYGHYDVQPVDPLELWETPPFEPKLSATPDGRKCVVARGACVDKGQVM